ncbi:flagellar hook-length control protein FliK [Colwellia sp. 12G3]|uniref:flagellar hook-length control protein FliK n=1 Tax=Colwellia sp. 12G3 TaxID=2058299 RepID=UPI000C33B4B9|nr:flagellar hook-length control protein FliK [Colwellia sp. 12G3]PKI14751.1 hypothetical protein CXF71_13405 [Colwellia sp. 12G3]
MQPVNVLPVFVSQDADLKNKESSNASAGSNKNTDFFSLVEQHLPEENKANSRKESTAAEQDAMATDGKTIAGNGKNDIDETNSRQENSAKQSQSASNTSGEAPVDEIQTKENEANKDSSTNNEPLTESEQFMALLYNSDQTLAEKGDKTKAGKDTFNANLGQVNDANINVDDATIMSKNAKAEVVAVSSSQDNPDLTSEHKLKAFSKDELLARTQLNNNNVLNTQLSGQALKDYQLSLQSQQGFIKSESITSEQLMNAQLANAKLNNNSITDVASGVSLASKSLLTEQVDSGLYQLPVEEVGKDESITENIANSAKVSVVKDEISQQKITQAGNKENLLVKPQGEIDAELASETVEDTLIPSTKKSDVSSDFLNVKPNKSDSGTSQLSTVNVDKLIVERNSQATVENISKEQSVANQDKQPVITSAQLQALQQIQAQQKVQSAISEQQALEGAGEEHIEPMLFAEEQPKEQGVKTNSKVIDNIAIRSVSELQTQTVQAMQTKQSNDAYLEHQVSEVLNHNVASDTAQIQKNNIQLQQETISIFRKDFADAVKDKVMMTINQKLQQFDITLDPPEFGNMQVRVNLQGEQASVNFVVQNQQAKDALEQNMHKLRDMLSEQGVDVGDANVEQQNQQQNNDEQNLQQNNGNRDILTNGTQKDEHNVEHILSAQLFDSSATSVDYYA